MGTLRFAHHYGFVIIARQDIASIRSAARRELGLMKPAQPTRYIRAVEAALGRLAKMEMLGMQMGDVRATSADISRLEAWVGFRPQTC